MDKPDKTSAQKNVTVVGDLIVDHHIYEGNRFTASLIHRPGLLVTRQFGGAAGLEKLISVTIELSQLDQGWKSQPGLVTPDMDSLAADYRAMAIWKPFKRDPEDKNSKEMVWRADHLLGFGQEIKPGSGPNTLISCDHIVPAKKIQTPDILVLDDGGIVFRNRENRDSWLLPDIKKAASTGWIILKMNSPVCQGDLWNELKGSRLANRLIVLVSANELRDECLLLSKGLSWERTVEEIREALLSSPFIRDLSRVPVHLIVTFSSDGALWIDNRNRDNPRATLVYDAAGAEGSWDSKFDGYAFGYMSCVVTALARRLMLDMDNPDLVAGIEAGLGAMRNLKKFGHGRVEISQPPSGYPVKRLAECIVKGSGDFSNCRIPWTEADWKNYAAYPFQEGDKRPWRIIEMIQSPFDSNSVPSLSGLASQVVLSGPEALKRMPHARFGALLTADRFEIESLRSLERLLLSYRKEKQAGKPLSIGVFGPPGAGKSFGVKQLARSIYGEDAWQEFNLSQFSGSSDLIGAFHQVRDMVLSGLTPVVFWDEFDSRNYYWLQYLLAPMQDGRFQEGQVNHPIGKCVFIFAGATSSTYQEFGPQKTTPDGKTSEAWREFALLKGPDFHSRLNGFLNVLGPNQQQRIVSAKGGLVKVPDERDVCTPLRRALLIRALLGVSKTARLDFDTDLLFALLLVPEYKFGARSLESIIQSIKPLYEDIPVRRSSLLAANFLAMHVNYENFNQTLNKSNAFFLDSVTEPLGAAIHHLYLELAHNNNWPVKPRFDKPYQDLDEIDKEDNRAAARRIPNLLALVGLKIDDLGNSTSGLDREVREHLEFHIDLLAEAEHDEWMRHRIKNGWQLNEIRNDDIKHHNLLIPYAILTDQNKEKDKNSIRSFPDMVKKAGYCINWIR